MRSLPTVLAYLPQLPTIPIDALFQNILAPSSATMPPLTIPIDALFQNILTPSSAAMPPLTIPIDALFQNVLARSSTTTYHPPIPVDGIFPEATKEQIPQVLAAHGFDPELLDGNKDNKLGVAVVDYFTDPEPSAYIGSSPAEAYAIAAHGDPLVRETKEDLPSDSLQVFEYEVSKPDEKNRITIESMDSALRQVLSDAREGKIDVLNLSYSVWIPLGQAPVLQTSTIQLLQEIRDEGVVIIVGGSNSPEHFNNYAAAENIIAVGSSTHRYSTELIDVAMPTDVRVTPVVRDGLLKGYDITGDGRVDIAQEVSHLNRQLSVRERLYEVRDGGTSIATPRYTNWVAEYLIGLLNQKD